MLRNAKRARKCTQFCAVKKVAVNNDLLLERESSVLIWVEESNEAVRLRLRDGEVTLVAEVVEDLEWCDRLGAVPVKSLEGRVRGEVADVAQALTGAFQGHLTVTDGDEQLFKSTFGFKSKAHDSIPTSAMVNRARVRFCWARGRTVNGSRPGMGKEKLAILRPAEILTNLFAKLKKFTKVVPRFQQLFN